MHRQFKIIKDGVSYNMLYTDAELKCQTCDVIVNKVSYSERTGIGEWICPELHFSRGVIGV
jgi:hypothetical protein